MTILVIDKTEQSELRDVFTVFGTPFKGTKLFWLGIPLYIIFGIVMALVAAPLEDLVAKIVAGVIYGILIVLATYLHTFGHIISSRMVGAPVTYIQLSATVNTAYYADTDELPSRVHIGRSIGGPVINLIVGLIVLAMYSSATNHYLAFFVFINLLLFSITILPIPTLDGAVILRELRK